MTPEALAWIGLVGVVLVVVVAALIVWAVKELEKPGAVPLFGQWDDED